jgi:hypothetical protein
MQPTLEMIESQLMLGNLDTARRLLSFMRPDAASELPYCERLWVFQQVIRRLETMETFAKAGEFARAKAELHAVESLCPGWPLIRQKTAELTQLNTKLESELEALFAAQVQGRWHDASVAAERVRRVCPSLPVARLMKSPWASQNQAHIADYRRPLQTHVPGPQGLSPFVQGRGSSRRNVRVSDDSGAPNSERFMIWIDGVGGYLGCLASIITIGQAIPGSHVDIPLQADISRRHAILRRQGEGYTIDPLHDVKINGKAVSEAAYLLDGDEIGLGDKVKLKFVKKHSLSASARLEFLSRHRTIPSADGVLLMADSLILGPQPHCHVICREWPAEVVLFKRPDGLGCRSTAPLLIDGQNVAGKPKLSFGAHLGSEGISMTLEKLS